MSLAPRDFATRHPIRHAYWEQMSDTTVLGAALYSFGIDPNAWYDELDSFSMEDMPYDELPPKFDERIDIICSAVRADIIKKLPNAMHNFVNQDTKIYLKSFFEWFKASPYAGKSIQTQASPTTPTTSTTPKPTIVKLDSQPKQSTNALSDFDSLKLDVIAQIFPLSTDPEENTSIWGNFAKNATRNGLDKARADKGKGKAQSTFYPEQVGEWLISKGRLDQAKLYRILARNLPPRSRDKLDYYNIAAL